MDFKLIGSPCGYHGPYTFYKGFKYSKNGKTNILALSEFFFVKLWNDSDLVSIGELQLLWEDRNSEQTLASLRLYILPESTPEGRNDCHGEHEVLAITEKVVLRVEDLLTWITEAADWSWGLAAIWDRDCPTKMSVPPRPQLLSDCNIDLGEIDKERDQLDEKNWEQDCGVVVLSFPRYCRYRGILKRLEGVHNKWLRTALVIALGGFTVPCRNTRVLFCKDTFDYPDLEGHELLCNHLAPKLKGRPRKRRKKLSISADGSASESESSSQSTVSLSNKSSPKKLVVVPKKPIPGLRCQPLSNITKTSAPVTTRDIIVTTSTASATTSSIALAVGSRRSTRSAGSPEEKEFLAKLHTFMKARQTPINRIPSIGYKEIDLYKFYNKVQHLGGYDIVTSSRLWKYVYEEMGGDHGSTSAATCSRRHYERLLLQYERHVTSMGTQSKTKPSATITTSSTSPTVSVKSARSLESMDINRTSAVITAVTSSSSVLAVAITATSTVTSTTISGDRKPSSASGKTSSLRSIRLKPDKIFGETTITATTTSSAKPRDKENIPIVSEPRFQSSPEVIDLVSDDSPVKVSPPAVTALKKQKLEILKEGGLEVTPVTAVPVMNGCLPLPINSDTRPSVIQRTIPTEVKGKVSITVTPDVSHMLAAGAFGTIKPAPKASSQHHPWSLGGSCAVYGNPKEVVQTNIRRPNPGEILDLRTKGSSKPALPYGSLGSNLEITLVPVSNNPSGPQQGRKRSLPSQTFPPQQQNPSVHRIPQAQRPTSTVSQRLTSSTVLQNGRLHHPVKSATAAAAIPNVSITVNHQQKRSRKSSQPSYTFSPQQMYSGFKGTNPYFPVIDTASYISAMYNGLFNPAPFLPSTTSSEVARQQFELYKQFINRHTSSSSGMQAPSAENFPCLLQQDSSTSITLVGQSPTPTSK